MPLDQAAVRRFKNINSRLLQAAKTYVCAGFCLPTQVAPAHAAGRSRSMAGRPASFLPLAGAGHANGRTHHARSRPSTVRRAAGPSMPLLPTAGRAAASWRHLAVAWRISSTRKALRPATQGQPWATPLPSRQKATGHTHDPLTGNLRNVPSNGGHGLKGSTAVARRLNFLLLGSNPPGG